MLLQLLIFYHNALPHTDILSAGVGRCKGAGTLSVRRQQCLPKGKASTQFIRPRAAPQQPQRYALGQRRGVGAQRSARAGIDCAGIAAGGVGD